MPRGPSCPDARTTGCWAAPKVPAAVATPVSPVSGETPSDGPAGSPHPPIVTQRMSDTTIDLPMVPDLSPTNDLPTPPTTPTDADRTSLVDDLGAADKTRSTGQKAVHSRSTVA